MAGDPYYFVLKAHDGQVAQAFFGALFGWSFDHGHVDNVRSPGAVIGGSGLPLVDLYFSVDSADDVAKVAARIVELGGTTEDLVDSRTGVSTTCTDPQGGRFCIGWQRPEFLATWTPPEPLPRGELGFVSLPAADANAATDFFHRVLGWEFAPADEAHAAGGYRHTSSPTPTVGIHPPADGDHPLLYFRVPDVAAAADDVTRHGGQAGTVAEADFGANATCRSPQGITFSLWNPAPGYH